MKEDSTSLDLSIAAIVEMEEEMDEEMPESGEEDEESSGYSLKTTIAACQDYYNFLTQMYLHPSSIAWPPRDGWPNITPESMAPLEKSPEVIELLRNLPYIKQDSDGLIQGSGQMTWADWNTSISQLQQSGTSLESLQELSEEDPDSVPEHVIGITTGGDNGGNFYLDTLEGNIYWLGCPEDIWDDPDLVREQTYHWQDEEDFSEGERNWRTSARVWTIPDFFEVLKDQFRRLKYIPLSEEAVEIAGCFPKEIQEVVVRTFREHGWPEPENYNKPQCLGAVKARVDNLSAF